MALPVLSCSLKTHDILSIKNYARFLHRVSVTYLSESFTATMVISSYYERMQGLPQHL